jgi:ATP-dependent DNA helicase RecG
MAKTAAARAAADPGTPEAPLSRLAKTLRLASDDEVLLCMPSDYMDCTEPERIAGAGAMDEPRAWVLRLTGVSLGFSRTPNSKTGKRRVQYQFGPRGKSGNAWKLGRLEVHAVDAQGSLISISLFNATPRDPAFTWAFEPIEGQEMWLHGTLQKYGSTFTLTRASIIPDGYRGRVWVRYKGVQGRLAGEHVERAVYQALGTEDAIDRSLRACSTRIVSETGLDEASILARADPDHAFETLDHLLISLHAPQSLHEGRYAAEAARHIAALSVQAAALRNNTRLPHPKAPIPIRPADIEQLVATQPETLTEDQHTVALEVARCLASPSPLVGLLSADVATGKTLPFILVAAAASLQGAKVAILAPTMLLADQIARQIFQRFDDLGVRVERVEAGDKIRDPSAILVGTSGLIGAARKHHYKPNFVICDEQHKHSTDVREGLLAPFTHLLEVTATPIPRSLASAMFGGMRIFSMSRSPVAKDIRSEVVDLAARPAILRSVLQAACDGSRAAFVYPAINAQPTPSSERDASASEQASGESDTESSQGEATPSFGLVEAARSLEEGLSRTRLGAGKVGILHGQMSDDEKKAALDRFRSGETPIVVASTVIETGIDVPDIRILIVRDADRFGVAQLHQLRGRLARNGGAGQFFMMVNSLDNATPETLLRLQGVASTTDGYKLAEMDLLQRGHGDLDGRSQSGDGDAVFKLTQLGAQDFIDRISPDKLTLTNYGGASFVRSGDESAANRPEQMRLV